MYVKVDVYVPLNGELWSRWVDVDSIPIYRSLIKLRFSIQRVLCLTTLENAIS